MYNYSFAQTGLDYAYLAYDVPLEKTEEAVNALKVLGCKGFNVTMPCKTRVAELVDELSDAAKLIGACNTVVVKDGKLYGNNTDGMGFVRNLKENGVDVKGKKITVMGAGGVEKSRDVAEQLRIVAERQGVHFMDAAECQFNQVDFMHLTCKGHAQLAEMLTDKVPKLV